MTKTKIKSKVDHVKIAACVRETYAVHVVFFGLGFTSDDVFVGVANIANETPPGLHAYVELRQGELTFRITLFGLTEKEDSVFKQAWLRFIEEKSQGKFTEKQLDEIVYGSAVHSSEAQIIISLQNKGFELNVGRNMN